MSGLPMVSKLACVAVLLSGALVASDPVRSEDAKVPTVQKLELVAGTGADASMSLKEFKASQTERFSLLKSGDDFLRIDRLKGGVSFCRQANGSWRCVPAPAAQDAYEAEISALSDEIGELESELIEMEDELTALDVKLAASESQLAAKEAELAARDAELAAKEAELAAALATLSEDAEQPRPGTATDAPADTSQAPEDTLSPKADADEPTAAAEAPEAAVEEPTADVEKQELGDVQEPQGDPEPRLSVQDREEMERMLDFTENAMRRFFGLMKDLQSEMDGSKGG